MKKCINLTYIYRFLTIKRCAIFATVVMNFIIMRNLPSRNLIISLVLLIGGAILAGVRNIKSYIINISGTVLIPTGTVILS